jgi:nitroimidazol reductase NimA-like FMN-containing flavoprotein (pyridoxamine 5'-phosphate oxidase superfamily)
MNAQHAPAPTLLESNDVKAVLARNSVGRLAFIRLYEIDILPIQYVYKAGVLYGRTAPDGKLAKMQRTGTKVAFEVDEIRSTQNWVSVLIHGTFEVVDRSDSECWSRAVQIIRQIHHEAFTEYDPRPHQSEIFQIRIREASGRSMH